MDIDDPIQQLLKNTGWSCDDLLEKLQKYKSQKENKKDPVELVQETGGRNLIYEKFVCDAVKDIQEINGSEVSTFDCDENTNKIKNTKNSVAISEKEFSDTDEEEVEVNVTNSNIIDEIINDIDNTDELNQITENTTYIPQLDNTEEQEEITEVRVIEVDEEDEDDYFEEECSYNVVKHNPVLLDSKNVEYLETFPRKGPIESIDLTEDDKNDISSEGNIIEKENDREKNVFNNVDDKKFISAKNSDCDNTINIKNTDICHNTLQIINDPKDDESTSRDDEITDRNSSKQIRKQPLDKGIDEKDTFIKKKNCEINCDRVCTILDKVQDNDLCYPTTERSNDQNENYVEENSELTDLEDIRNNLKLQLNSLRTRKRGHFLQQLRSKVVDSSECNIKKLNSFESPEIANNEKHNGTKDSFKKLLTTGSGKEHDLYTQTNEFGLVILSVQGGIDIGDQNNESNKQDVINEDSSNTVSSALENSTDSNSFVVQNTLENTEVNETSEVFNEIRKIIRKQKLNNSVNDTRNTTKEVRNPKFNCFSRSTTTPLKMHEESNEKTECSSASADNSQSSFTYDETSQNIDKNSPFVSNTLDEFLTGNSKLNISYKIPKSGAEEGLTDSYYEESPLILKKTVEVHNENIPISKRTETIKAKTVAQKRKLLEKQRLKELKKQGKFIKQSENVINNVEAARQKRCSYIEINNRKLWVKGTKPNICIAKIKSPVTAGPPLKNCYQKKKLSLLTELAKKYNEKIKYLPGPLSKKSTLQVNGHDNWKTETKLLPKITLEVTPKIGQCLPSDIISRLPQCDGLITTDLAEFALSMLRTKYNTFTENKTFKFPIKYMNNQENIIVKKQKTTPLKYNTEEKSNEDKCINSVVANVIDDLIRYVEIKEIAPTLIKEEEDIEYNYKDGKLDKMPIIAENISSIIKKPPKKKSKVELELLRLSCKVVNVEVEENSTEESCYKSYCQLGCVCKSLKCDGMITYHCQNVGCMLECKCPREKSIEYDKLMLPAGTDILSKDTVTRIEDEAKKDLAKVEREFTQMVIHTNDKTIVVGTGGRHKTRRSTKAPMKYSDYIDSNFECIEEDVKIKTQEIKHFSKECIVSLDRLSLQDIIPYCMLHNVYSCHCEAKSLPVNYISRNATTKISSKPISEETTEKKPITDKKYLKGIKMTLPKQPKIEKESLSDSNNLDNSPRIDIKMSTSGRPIRVNKKLKEDFTYFNELDFQSVGCARTLGVPFHIRTKRKHSIKSLSKLIKYDFSNNITQSEVLKSKLLVNSPDALEVDILKRQLVLDSEKDKKSMSLLIEKALSESKHKRKQTLEVRNDDAIPKPLFNQHLAIQRRKKTGFVTRRNTVIEPVFDGEIIVDERNMELLQKMGNRTVSEGYARLLPWRALINSFNKGNVNIWCMVDQPSRLLINKCDKTPPKNYIDIRRTTQTTEVILWILKNKLPQRYHEDHISFILKQTKDNYEICGLCTKNFNDTNPINCEKELSKVNTGKDTGFFKHKDLNGVQQVLCLSKGRFKLQELVEETLAAVGETSIEKNKLYMWAALPEIYPMCKWRMIFLNSDFTFLYFIKIKYSIKYTDLLSASNKAKEANCTVILRNSIICNPNYHSAFGIYFDAHYQDRLFIGPYFKQHKYDDIETLRYINQSLVCTESFNKMQGKTDYKCGHWLVERPYSRKSGKHTIDLTRNTYSKGVKRKNELEFPLSIKKQKCSFEENERIIVTQNNDCIKVLDSEPRTPEQFNRYIITNIPHLGYLGAFQHKDSSEIDVSWPFENKLLRFPSVRSATDFLQCRFSSLLQPVPETFRINIIVMTNIDLEKTKPIDVSILSGHYICGEFGCYNVKTITNEFCVNKIGTSREELLRIFARRAQIFVRQKIEELADVVNIPKSEERRNDIVNILDKARENIESLIELEKRNIVEKDGLLLQKRELAVKAFCLISALPENERNAECWKFRQILKKRSILLPKTVVEPIEILDSDDEEKNTPSQIESSTKQDIECNIHVLTEALTSDSGFMDRNYGFAEITPLPKVDPLKVPSSKQSDLLKPLLVDKHIPNKINQTTVATYPPQRKLKSILKSSTTPMTVTPIISRVESSSSLSGQLVSPTSQFGVNKISNQPKQQYLTGVKLVKTSEGKLMLVSENPSAIGKSLKFTSAGAKQVVIKNNEILSVKSISPLKKDGPQNIFESETTSVKLPNSPPKTIILKKSALLMKSKILAANDGTLLQNKANENSVLKNVHLLMPQVSMPEKHSKPTDNIDDSNDNGTITKCDLNKVTSEKDKLVTDESKTTVEVCNDVEMKNITNADEKSCLESYSNPKFVEIPTQICSTINNNISAPSRDIIEESPTNAIEQISLEDTTDTKSNDEKGRMDEDTCSKTDSNCSQRTVVIENKTSLQKPSNFEGHERRDNEQTESSCNRDTGGLKDAESSSLVLQDESNLEERHDTTLKNGKQFDSNIDASHMESKSDSDNPTECIDQTFNNDMPFLVNTVSEIVPHKPDSEMSTEIDLANAAPLTQMKNAACDNSKDSLLPLENKDSIKSDSNANSEANEQNCLYKESSIHNIDPVIATQVNINEITLESVIGTLEENNKCTHTLSNVSKIVSPNVSNAINSTNEDNITEETAASVVSVEGNILKSNKKEISLEEQMPNINLISTSHKVNGDDLCWINKEIIKDNIHIPTTTDQNSETTNETVNPNDKYNLIYEEVPIDNTNDSKYSDIKDFSKDGVLPLKTDKESIEKPQACIDFSKIDININSKSEAVLHNNESKMPMDISSNQKSFKDSTYAKIPNQIQQQISVQSITTDNSVTQTISNLVNHEALIKICSNAIKNECAKTNVEAIKDISISVAVTVSAQIDNESTLEYNANTINEKPLTRNIVVKKPDSAKNGNKNVTKSSILNKTARKSSHLKLKRKSERSSQILERNASLPKNAVHKNTMFATGKKRKWIKSSISNKLTSKSQINKSTKPYKSKKLCGKNEKILNSRRNRKVDSSKNQSVLISVCQQNPLKMKSDVNQKIENINVYCEPKMEHAATNITVSNEGNEESLSKKTITDQISNENDSKFHFHSLNRGSKTLALAPGTSPRKKRLIKNNFPKSCIKLQKNMTSAVDDNIQNISQRNPKALKASLPISQNSSVVNDKQFAVNTVVNNSLVTQLKDGYNENNMNIFLNESNNEEVLINADETMLNTSIARYPLSKRISNVVVHTLNAENSPDNYDVSKENTKTGVNIHTDENNIIIPKTDQEISSVENSIVKEVIPPFKTNKVEKTNISSISCTSDLFSDQDSSSSTNCGNVKDHTKGNRSQDNKKTVSQIKNILVPKRPMIKCVSAKVNTLFTIDNDSFRKVKSRNTKPSIQKAKIAVVDDSCLIAKDFFQKPVKKSTPSERGRIRKEIISTTDLFVASKMFKAENKEGKYIADKICSLAESAIKVKPLNIINKESFLKNARLAEKVINIGNMKKKLHANICEDGNCRKSSS